MTLFCAAAQATASGPGEGLATGPAENLDEDVGSVVARVGGMVDSANVEGAGQKPHTCQSAERMRAA
jgi:hypothetical protein